RRIRVTRFNAISRVGSLLGLYLLLSQAAYADTVLNFVKATLNDRLNAAFSITNPTSNYADVQFTYYGLDGNPVSPGLVNPVRYRVAAKGQISMRASELFAGSRADGWVQVTSTTSGLTGFYLYGDFATRLEGSDSVPGLNEQILPVIREDQLNKTELVIVNRARGQHRYREGIQREWRTGWQYSVAGHSEPRSAAIAFPGPELYGSGLAVCQDLGERPCSGHCNCRQRRFLVLRCGTGCEPNGFAARRAAFRHEWRVL